MADDEYIQTLENQIESLEDSVEQKMKEQDNLRNDMKIQNEMIVRIAEQLNDAIKRARRELEDYYKNYDIDDQPKPVEEKASEIGRDPNDNINEAENTIEENEASKMGRKFRFQKSNFDYISNSINNAEKIIGSLGYNSYSVIEDVLKSAMKNKIAEIDKMEEQYADIPGIIKSYTDDYYEYYSAFEDNINWYMDFMGITGDPQEGCCNTAG